MKDKLLFNFTNITTHLKEQVIMKRIDLSSIAKIFDLLELPAPVTMSLKILFQTLCKMKVDWDSPLEDGTSRTWRSLMVDMRDMESMSINRSYLSGLRPKEPISVELQGFMDSCMLAGL